MSNEVDYIKERLGTRNWVVADHLSPKLKSMGFEVAISGKKYHALKLDWERLTYGAPLEALQKAAPDLLAALKKIADRGPAKAPEEEDYDDTESAYNNGVDVAAWEAATIARSAIAKVDPQPKAKRQANNRRTA